MAPPYVEAKLTLTYPIYAVDFDPRNNGSLIVGGGGGEGRSGVSNKITLIDTYRKHDIREVVDIELSRSEDSVTSLAVAQSDETFATVFAGINSSSADQQAGKNEHLRSFRLGYPPKKNPKDTKEASALRPETKALGKISMFTALNVAKKETYQRVIRLSRPKSDSGARLGAIATGLAPAGEVVIFNVNKSVPGSNDVRQRIQLGNGEEAADVDIVDSEVGGYLMAYCTNYDVCISRIPADSSTPKQPTLIYTTTQPVASSKTKKRPVFRSLRFLTPALILLLRNLPDRTGAELLLLEVPKDLTTGLILLVKSLHKSIKSATALATATMTAPTPSQNIQHAIAVAGQDITLTILTLDHNPQTNRNLSFRQYAFLRDVHPLQMTALTFSTFIPPSDPAKALPQYLKLASTSMSQTVIVHTFPLTPYPAPSSKQKEPSRYTLLNPGARSEIAQNGFSVLVSILMIAIGAFLLQAFVEIRGGSPDHLGAKNWLPTSIQDLIARPYMFDAPVITSDLPPLEKVRDKVAHHYEEIMDSIPTVEEVTASIPSTEDVKASIDEMRQAIPKGPRIRELLEQKAPAPVPSDEDEDEDDEDEDDEDDESLAPKMHVLITDKGGEEVGATTHHDEGHLAKHGKKWEHLSHEEKRSWRKKLVDSGNLAADQGEAVLKGVFFGQLADIVAGAMQG